MCKILKVILKIKPVMIFWKIHLPFKEKTFINGPRDIINCLQIVLFEYFEKVLTDSCP